jgi:hypothetical protein
VKVLGIFGVFAPLFWIIRRNNELGLRQEDYQLKNSKAREGKIDLLGVEWRER